MPLTARVASSRAPFTCSTPRRILMRCERRIHARRSCLAKARASVGARLATLAARPSTAPPLRRRAALGTSSASLSPPACTSRVPPPACEQVHPLASSVLAPRHSQRLASLLLAHARLSGILSPLARLPPTAPTQHVRVPDSLMRARRHLLPCRFERRRQALFVSPTPPHPCTQHTTHHVSRGRVPVSRSPSIQPRSTSHLPGCLRCSLSRCAFCTTATLYRPVTPWRCAHSCMQMG
jgi:hypothetical protein